MTEPGRIVEMLGFFHQKSGKWEMRSRRICKGATVLRDSLKSRGYSVKRVKPVYNRARIFSRFAVVEFTTDWAGYESAMNFDGDFRLLHKGRHDWLADAQRIGIYGWIAGPQDFECRDGVGSLLQKGRYLRTVADVQEQERRHAQCRAEYVARTRAKQIEEDENDSAEDHESASKKQKLNEVDGVNP